MNKIWKWFLSISLLFVLIIFAFVMIENQLVASLPIKLMPMTDYLWIGPFIPYFLFWVSGALGLATLILLILVLFYPVEKHTLTLQQSDGGKLKIQKKAIEQFVMQIVQKEPFIDAPTVKVTIRKKTIKVKISGKMRKLLDVPEHQRRLLTDVKQELTNLLGASDKIVTEIVLNDYAPKKKHVNSNRVK